MQTVYCLTLRQYQRFDFIFPPVWWYHWLRCSCSFWLAVLRDENAEACFDRLGVSVMYIFQRWFAEVSCLTIR